MQKTIWLGFIVFISAQALANGGVLSTRHPTSHHVVDLYGDESTQSETILQKYAKRVSEIQDRLLGSFSLNAEHKLAEQGMMNLTFQRNRLRHQIQAAGNYSYANFQTVSYPEHKTRWTTIEVIKRDQPERLRLVTPQDLLAWDPENGEGAMEGSIGSNQMGTSMGNHLKEDLIQKMITFEHLEMRLLLSHQLNLNQRFCPVYHCVSGFAHPQLRPYLEIFNAGVLKEKALIVDTLSHDGDPERRAAAAFLIGHFHDPQEIFSLLAAHVNDRDEGVRNNVLRVMAETMKIANMPSLNLMPFIDLLNSPYGTDRNKALMILHSAAKDKRTHPMIIQQGGKNLLRLLELKQPNNHQLAYQILRRISGRNFAENDSATWKQWVASAQQKMS